MLVVDQRGEKGGKKLAILAQKSIFLSNYSLVFTHEQVYN